MLKDTVEDVSMVTVSVVILTSNNNGLLNMYSEGCVYLNIDGNMIVKKKLNSDKVRYTSTNYTIETIDYFDLKIIVIHCIYSGCGECSLNTE